MTSATESVLRQPQPFLPQIPVSSQATVPRRPRRAAQSRRHTPVARRLPSTVRRRSRRSRNRAVLCVDRRLSSGPASHRGPSPHCHRNRVERWRWARSATSCHGRSSRPRTPVVVRDSRQSVARWCVTLAPWIRESRHSEAGPQPPSSQPQIRHFVIRVRRDKLNACTMLEN